MLMEGSGVRELAEESASVSPALPPAQRAAAPAEREPTTLDAGPPLSHGQQMLWYAHQFTTTGAAYHVLGAGLVRAELDKGASAGRWGDVIARQEALRTTFILVDEKPAARHHGVTNSLSARTNGS